MEKERTTFEKLIREDRAARESKHWRGTLLEYLDGCTKTPPSPSFLMRVSTT